MSELVCYALSLHSFLFQILTDNKKPCEPQEVDNISEIPKLTSEATDTKCDTKTRNHKQVTPLTVLLGCKRQ